MNYLALCQRAVQEAGISGGGPSSVENQQGQLKKIVDWVEQAWVDVQLMRPNWNFMWEEFTFDTVDATRDYLAADQSINDLSLWDTGSFLLHDPAIGYTDQGGLRYLPHAKWRAQYKNQMKARPDERPQLFTILPNRKIRFEPEPDGVYTLEGEYKRTAQHFTSGADEPTNFPDDFHLIIVWQALKYYGHYEDAPDVLEEAETNFDNLLLRLEVEELPEFSEDYASLA